MKHFASYYIESIRSQMPVFEMINKLISLDSDIRLIQAKIKAADSPDAIKERVSVLSIVTEYLKKTQERTRLVRDVFQSVENSISPLLEYMEEKMGEEDFLTNFKYIQGQFDSAIGCIKMCGESQVGFSNEFTRRINDCVERCNKMSEDEYKILKDNMMELVKDRVNVPKVKVEEL